MDNIPVQVNHAVNDLLWNWLVLLSLCRGSCYPPRPRKCSLCYLEHRLPPLMGILITGFVLLNRQKNQRQANTISIVVMMITGLAFTLIYMHGIWNPLTFHTLPIRTNPHSALALQQPGQSLSQSGLSAFDRWIFHRHFDQARLCPGLCKQGKFNEYDQWQNRGDGGIQEGHQV